MSKSIDVQLSQLQFPMTCVVCMSPATKPYKLDRIFTYGRRSYTVTVNVPMCELHFNAVSYKGKAERLVGWLGVGIGILVGLFPFRSPRSLPIRFPRRHAMQCRLRATGPKINLSNWNSNTITWQILYRRWTELKDLLAEAGLFLLI